jgi:spermidine synthase
MVFLDGHESSYVDLADPTHLEFSYVRRMGDVIDLLRPARQPIDVLHVGGGGFTLPRYVAATRPRSRQVVFEYDAELVRIAREHLALAPSPGLRVRVGDARVRLAERPDASADVVVGDAFDGVAVPAHLATLEFAREIRRVLRPDGVYLLNVIDCPPLRVSRAEAATLPLEELRKAASRGAFPDDVLDRAAVTRFAGSAAIATDDTTDRWAKIVPPPDLPVPLHGD